ncbi:L-2,4-diaminobutyrate decarboxylase-like [Folsomia candida]|uniref:L-2,4-diaminobutyrate decarboxylase-like n=1 Tax=Folsomia candida TaxID=158441 RepID=UPI0016054FC4|nr:L-2,4-diaminobutyrate decarboxylase-like [Folsomia candida]
MPSTGTDIFDLLSFVTENIVEPSTNFGSPYAMAFPDAGNSVAGICGDILTAFLNQNLINWTPCSPSATVVEITVISWLRDLLGYTVASNISAPIDVGGLITSGGVLSNTIALLLARESAMPDCMRVGFNSKKGATPSIIVPDGIDHYSSRISAGWLGLGEANVFKAPSKNFKYDLDVLPQIVANLKSSSHKPILLVCYAGDSRSMSTDNFKEIRRICDTYGMWMHVDGCQGTQLIFSNKNRSKIHGIHLADSVTLDPHKVLAVPYAISVFLVKNPKHLETIKRPEDIITGEKHSFGQITPFQGSRSFASLKLFMMMKHLGREGIGRMIDRRCCFAKFVAEVSHK